MAKDTKKPKKTRKQLVEENKCLKKTRKQLVEENKCLKNTINYFYELSKTYAQVISLIAEEYNPDDKDGFLKPFFDKLEEQQKQKKNQGEN